MTKKKSCSNTAKHKKLFKQGRCHLMTRVDQDHFDLEKKIIHNNLKFYIYLPLKKILEHPKFFLCQ